MATDDLKKMVAREAASGERTSDIARRHGYSRRGMAKLLASAEVERLTEAEREKLDELTEQHRAQLVLCGGTALEHIRQVVEDPDHPRCLDTSRWLLDKILPTRGQTPTVAVAFQAMDARVAAEIAEGLKVMTEKFGSAGRVAGCEKYLLRGTQGIDSAED